MSKSARLFCDTEGICPFGFQMSFDSNVFFHLNFEGDNQQKRATLNQRCMSNLSRKNHYDD